MDKALRRRMASLKMLVSPEITSTWNESARKFPDYSWGPLGSGRHAQADINRSGDSDMASIQWDVRLELKKSQYISGMDSSQ